MRIGKKKEKKVKGMRRDDEKGARREADGRSGKIEAENVIERYNEQTPRNLANGLPPSCSRDTRYTAIPSEVVVVVVIVVVGCFAPAWISKRRGDSYFRDMFPAVVSTGMAEKKQEKIRGKNEFNL